MGRERGRRGADIDDKVDQLRVRVKQRKELNSGRQAFEKAIKLPQRLIGVGAPRQPLEDLGLDPAEDRAGPLRTQAGIAAPALHRRRRLGREIGPVLGLAGGEKRPGQRLDPRQPRAKPRGPGPRIALAHHRREQG